MIDIFMDSSIHRR